MLKRSLEMIIQKVITSQAYQASGIRLLLQPPVRVTGPPQIGQEKKKKKKKAEKETAYIKDLSLSSPLWLFWDRKSLFCVPYRHEERFLDSSGKRPLRGGLKVNYYIREFSHFHWVNYQFSFTCSNATVTLQTKWTGYCTQLATVPTEKMSQC